MAYTVGEMAKRLDVPASTLRYYDKEGLLPFVARSPGGMRIFQDADLEWLKVIGCLKKAGMSIKNIRVYIELAMQGDETIDQRLELFREPAGSAPEPADGAAGDHGDAGVQVLVLRGRPGGGDGGSAPEHDRGEHPGGTPQDLPSSERAGGVRP